MPPPILPLREPTAIGPGRQRLDRAAAAPAPAASAASGAAPAASAAAQPRTGPDADACSRPRSRRAPAAAAALPSPAGTADADDPALETAVALEQLPLPVFIDTVFATILKRNVSVDPAIASRKEFVSLKSGKPQTASQLYEAAQGGAQVLRHRRHRVQRPGARHARRGQRRLRARGAPWPQPARRAGRAAAGVPDRRPRDASARPASSAGCAPCSASACWCRTTSATRPS